MNLVKLFLALTIFIFITNLFASPVNRNFRDLKLPTQIMLEEQTISNPTVAGTADLLSFFGGAEDATATSVTTFVAQPDVPRNLVITPYSTTADIEACIITVTGTDFHGATMLELFGFAANAGTATTGNNAFKSVVSVAFPANCESGGFDAEWAIGFGEKLGLKRCLSNAGHYFGSTVAGAWEATRATVTASASNIRGNTADFNGTMNGSNDFEIFFVQNFIKACFP